MALCSCRYLEMFWKEKEQYIYIYIQSWLTSPEKSSSYASITLQWDDDGISCRKKDDVYIKIPSGRAVGPSLWGPASSITAAKSRSDYLSLLLLLPSICYCINITVTGWALSWRWLASSSPTQGSLRYTYIHNPKAIQQQKNVYLKNMTRNWHSLSTFFSSI